MKTAPLIFSLAIVCFGCSKKDQGPQAPAGEHYIKFKADGHWQMIDQSVDIFAWQIPQPNSDGGYEFGINRYSGPFPLQNPWSPVIDPGLVFQIHISDSLKVDAGKTYTCKSADNNYHPFYASLFYASDVGTENQIQYSYSYNVTISITSITDNSVSGTFSGLIKERTPPGRTSNITDGSFLSAFRH